MGPPLANPESLKKTHRLDRPAIPSWILGGFRRWWRRGCLWFSRPSLRASPLGELREVALIRWMGISPLKNHQPNKTVELRNFEVVIVREDEICWWCELLEVFSTVDLRIKWDFWRYVEHLPTMRSAVTHLWIQTPVKMIQRFKGRAYCRTSMYSKPTNIFCWRWFLRHCFGPRLPWSSWPGDFLLCCSWWLLDVEFWWESPESHGFYPGVVWVGGIVPSLKPQWCPRNAVKQTSKALGSEDKKKANQSKGPHLGGIRINQ